MAMLPDDLWLQILTTATAGDRFSARDLCSLAITSRRLNRLSQNPSIWSNLLRLHFPEPHPQPPSKNLYKARYEGEKARREAETKRAVLRAESAVAVCQARLRELEFRIGEESERQKAASVELAYIERVRAASVAQNVWQPQIVRGSQKQIVEQCTVPVSSRLHSLKNEVGLCRQQLATYKKSHNEQKQKLSHYKEVLASLKYHPVLDSEDSNMTLLKKRRKLKTSNEFTPESS